MLSSRNYTVWTAPVLAVDDSVLQTTIESMADPTQHNIFARRLREIMDIRGMNRAEVARRTNVARSTISRYLGESLPNSVAACRIADVLNVNLDFLYGRDILRAVGPHVNLIYDAMLTFSDDQRDVFTNYIESLFPDSDGNRAEQALADPAAFLRELRYHDIDRLFAFTLGITSRRP